MSFVSHAAGCLPPPTPSPASAFASIVFGELAEKGTNFKKYNKELDPSLAFRCSTRKGMVEGIGAFIDPNNLTVPENPSDMGFIMKNGRLTRMERPRRNGDPAFWQTSSERVLNYHHGGEIVKFPDAY